MKETNLKIKGSNQLLIEAPVISTAVCRSGTTSEGGGLAASIESRRSLALEYQQAKRDYKASKLLSNASKENEGNASSVAAKTKPRTSKPKSRPSTGLGHTVKASKNLLPPSASPNGAPIERMSKSNDDSTAPSKERGLELLGLVRPSDTRAEHGLSDAIQVHLIESIKLCNLKSRRETSLISMVQTLCNHLSNREKEIATWTQFADTVATSAAGKLQESLDKVKRACRSRDDARETAKTCQKALEQIRVLFGSLKASHATLKEDVVDLLSTISPLIAEMRAELGSHSDNLHSESKMELCDAVEELARVHDIEKQQLETKIHSLTQSVNSGANKIQQLQDQIDTNHKDLDAEKTRYSKLQDELCKANDRIQHLEKCLEVERIKNQDEIADMNAKMNKQLDDIETRVKESFQQLSERKDKDIAAALQRAQNAESVLEELQASLSQMTVTTKP